MSLGSPGVQYGRDMVDLFLANAGDALSSALVTEEYGKFYGRLHYHGVLVAGAHIKLRHLRPWWRGSKRPHIKLAGSRSGVVAYVLKYCFKDLYSGKAEGWLTTKRPGVLSALVPEPLALARGKRMLHAQHQGDSMERWGVGSTPNPLKVGGRSQRVRTSRDLAIARQLLADGWTKDDDPADLVDAFDDQYEKLEDEEWLAAAHPESPLGGMVAQAAGA